MFFEEGDLVAGLNIYATRADAFDDLAETHGTGYGHPRRPRAQRGGAPGTDREPRTRLGDQS
jgi:hypothetical protein